MKIAFVVHTAHPDFIGGREHHVHNLAQALTKTDEVVVLAGGRGYRLMRRKLDNYELITLPTFSVKVSNNPLQYYRITRGLFAALERENPNVVHAFEYGSQTTQIAWRFAECHHIPFFLSVYGYQLRNPLLKLAKIFYDGWFGRQLLEKAEKIFCPSPVQYEETARILQGRPEGKVVLKPNGIVTEEFRDLPVSQGLAKKLGLNDEIKLLTVSRLLPRKGIKNLILAIDRVVCYYGFRGVKLIIIGPDCGEKKNLSQLVRKLRLEQKVILADPVPYGGIKDFLGLCDIFVLPSTYEGFPLALLEAMSAGKAVVFSDLQGSHQVILHNRNGCLVHPGDVAGLARTILRLSSDIDFRRLLGANARDTAALFDVSSEANQLQALYQDASSMKNTDRAKGA